MQLKFINLLPVCFLINKAETFYLIKKVEINNCFSKNNTLILAGSLSRTCIHYDKPNTFSRAYL